MKVRDIFIAGAVHTCTPETSWQEAASLLLANRVSAMPVVDEEGKLMGILSEKDLFRAFFPNFKEWMQESYSNEDYDRMLAGVKGATTHCVKEVMSPRLLTATLETPVLKIGAYMVGSGIHQVPIVQDGKLLGMVSRGTIYRAILSEYFEMHH
jgi:CBS domain-containing protein